MIEKIAEYRKAIAGFVVPVLVVLGTSLTDGVVTAQEWIAVAIAAFGTSIVVGAVPNKLQDAQVAKHVAENGIPGSGE